MTISFTVADDIVCELRSATVRPRQLAAFRSFARSESERTGVTIIDPSGRGFAATDFEARICPFSLATVSALFDHDPDVIEVLEEAQFRARLVRFSRDEADGTLRVHVAATPDGALEMAVANTNAYAILHALGLKPEPIGEIASEELRSKLQDPDVRARFAAEHLEHYATQLTSLAWLSSDASNARIVWA